MLPINIDKCYLTSVIQTDRMEKIGFIDNCYYLIASDRLNIVKTYSTDYYFYLTANTKMSTHHNCQ